MARKIDVVIGANYGDEGKGLVTNNIAANNDEKSLVVRFNGGGQAGHTVEYPDGTRHIFSHIGAGTLAGADTYLSKHFVLNPVVFMKESDELRMVHDKPFKVFANANSPITTPYDVLINRALEKRRGFGRHGSVGIGFGETIEREQNGVHFNAYRHDSNALNEVVEWFWYRLENLGINDLTLDEINVVSDSKGYYSALDYLEKNVIWVDDNSGVDDILFNVYDNLIFEGAQGLLLDMDYGDFPHVTRSNTGLKNVVDILGDDFEEIDVHYVTRTFLTRHGAGPLENEIFDFGVSDDTNVYNPWQESLRYAALMNAKDLVERCENDFLIYSPKNSRLHYAVTWCNIGFVDIEAADHRIPYQVKRFYNKFGV